MEKKRAATELTKLCVNYKTQKDLILPVRVSPRTVEENQFHTFKHIAKRNVSYWCGRHLVKRIRSM